MAKVQALPGMEKKTVKEIEESAEAYVEQRDKRMKLTTKEVEARDALIAVMQKHKLSVYRDESVDPPLLVTLTEGAVKVKVKKETEEEEADDGSDDAE